MNIKNQVWGLADVSVCFLFLWSNTDQNQLGEERVHFSLQVTVSIMKASQTGDQGRSLEPGIKAETIEKCCLLACFACSALQLRSTCPNMTPSIVHQSAGKKRPTDIPKGQSLSWDSLFPGVSECVSSWQNYDIWCQHLCHLRTIDLN